MNETDKDHPLADIDSGLQCLMMMARLHGIAADAQQLQHRFGRQPFEMQTILLAARVLGMTAKCLHQQRERLERTPLPAIGIDRNGRFFVLAKVEQAQGETAHGQRILVQQPGQAPQVLSQRDFEALWSGQVILFTSKASYAQESSRFDFSWFIPAVVKYRKTLAEVLLISLVLQLIGLITPMFFQVVMDKVLVNHAMMTLNVIAVGLIAATVFEAVLTGIRTAIFANASSKIDVELGSRLFSHLLSLPLSYFQVRRAGDSIARVRELENIRSFLTGNAMTLVLDIMFSFVFLGVMLWYSVSLSLIVLASIPVYVLLSLVFTPLLRERLNDKFNKSAENQSFLVETLTGMDTVKAMAVEPRWQQKWDKQLAAYVAAGLTTTNISLLASGAVGLVSKLVTVGIMWMGALLVVKNEMSVGELVAFNMLAGQVASPILRLAQLWNDFQQIGISMSRLADVLDARTEVAGMYGDEGDDIYIVNTGDDRTVETINGGHDTVIASCSTTLAVNVEDLRLVEGGNLNGTGNTLDNLIVGNSQDNILDGSVGADTMIGGLGNDSYFIDDAGDQVIEAADEGVDTVYSRISMRLAANVENLTLLDGGKPLRGMVEGKQALIYGAPKAYDLDYQQGNGVTGYRGTCGETSVVNVLRMADQWVSEKEVVQRAIDNKWCITDAPSATERGGSSARDQKRLLESYGLRADCSFNYDQDKLAALVKEGQGVMVSVDSRRLWSGKGQNFTDHVVTVTSVAYAAETGDLMGFYIADSGRSVAEDAARYVSADELRAMADVRGSSMVYTLDPIKLRQQNLAATGNELDNILVGNRGDNLITGGKGNDTLVGQGGNDTYVFGKGDGRDLVVDQDATAGNVDTIKFSDTMIGGQGNDRYFVDNVGDQVIEEAGEGIDTVYSTVSMTLGANVENLTLMDARTPVHGEVYGQDALIYGTPKSYLLDYDQGDAVPGFAGTCGETSVTNILKMAGLNVTEKDTVQLAIDKDWCTTDPSVPVSRRGGIGIDLMVTMMESFGVDGSWCVDNDLSQLPKLIKQGHAAALIIDAEALWDLGAYMKGVREGPHAVAVSGVACSAKTGEVLGFYITDSGPARYSELNRFLPMADLINVDDGFKDVIYTEKPVKLRNRNSSATGNELDNVLVGNLDDNLITGGKGNDTLAGQAGNDTYVFGKGDGRDLVVDQDATAGNVDTIKFSDAKQTNLWFSQVGKDLQIDVLGSTDQVTVKDWYAGTSNRIERIKTADGKTMYDSDVDKLVQAMASFDPPAATQTSWTEGQTSKGKVLLTVTH